MFSRLTSIQLKNIGHRYLTKQTNADRTQSNIVHYLQTFLNNMTNKRIKIDDIDVLKSDSCHIKDRDRVTDILNELVAGGTGKLQIVTDFDYTITKQKCENGDPVLSSFGMFNECHSLSHEFKIDVKELHDYYRPLEIDPNIPFDQKKELMIDWWLKSSSMLIDLKFNSQDIDDVTKRFKNALRDGTRRLFNECQRNDVPILVFSAGLGDCVTSLLKQADVLMPNVKVVSNFLLYKDDGRLNGFDTTNMIHTFNKNETVLKGSEYYELVHDRDHVIVMGDSLGDADMANGVPSSSHILKIGFLFDHIEQNLPQYMNTFDIVLTDDQTMDVPRAILDKIINF